MKTILLTILSLALVGCNQQQLEVTKNTEYGQIKRTHGYWTGVIEAPPFLKEMNMHKRQCENGDKDKCYDIGIFYATQGPYFNRENASKYLIKACAMEQEKACSKLNQDNLKKVEQIKSKKVKYEHTRENLTSFKDLCNQGDASKCFILGGYYLSSDDASPIKSLMYFDKGCTKGTGKSMASCCYLSGILSQGSIEHGIPINLRKSQSALSKGCKAGNNNACNMLYVLNRDIQYGRLR